MTVRELIEKLEEFGDHIEVRILIEKEEKSLFLTVDNIDIEGDVKTGEDYLSITHYPESK